MIMRDWVGLRQGRKDGIAKKNKDGRRSSETNLKPKQKKQPAVTLSNRKTPKGSGREEEEGEKGKKFRTIRLSKKQKKQSIKSKAG